MIINLRPENINHANNVNDILKTICINSSIFTYFLSLQTYDTLWLNLAYYKSSYAIQKWICKMSNTSETGELTEEEEDATNSSAEFESELCKFQ